MNEITKENLVDYIMDYESDVLSEKDTIMLFQYLIDSGLAWQLQGHYGRMANYFIESGICNLPNKRKER